MDGVIRTSVCFFCHDGSGKYLISRRSQNCRDEQGRWDPGAGGVKFGEKIEDALCREIREEYRTVPLEAEFLGYRDVFREQEGKPTHWIAMDFRARVDRGMVEIGEPHKCDELRWVTLEELRAYPQEELHSQFPLFLELWKNRL